MRVPQKGCKLIVLCCLITANVLGDTEGESSARDVHGENKYRVTTTAT